MIKTFRRWIDPLIPGRSAAARREHWATMDSGTILVLCTGNICRSPIACALLRSGLARARAGLSIESAGISALVGKPADPLAIDVMAERGIDITGHRARQVSREMLRAAEIVLVMETGQKRFLTRKLRVARQNTFRLCEAQGVDVPDPYLGSRADFEAALELMDAGVRSWLSILDGGDAAEAGPAA